MSVLTAAVVQSGSHLFDTPKSIELLEAKTRQAAAAGARLIVFPEAFIGGYPKGNHFGAPVGSRSEQGREWFRRYHESAIDIPGDQTQQIEALCGELSVDLVVGVVERGQTGTLFCSVVAFSAAGKLIGKRRKLIPTAAERIIWGQGDGSTLNAFDASCGKLCGVICWENLMPAVRISQYAQGVEFYCAPTVDDRPTWTALAQTIAMEGRCFVLSANQFMTRAHVPEQFETIQGNDNETVLINGGSTIVSPLGEVLAGPHFGSETILYADLDKAQLARSRMDFDVVGHYSRPDVFQLHVDSSRKTNVKFQPGLFTATGVDSTSGQQKQEKR